MDWAPRWLRAKHTLTELSLDSALGFYRTITKVHRERRRALYSGSLKAELGDYDPAQRVAELMDRCDDGDSLLQAQFVDIGLYLPGDILTKVDRTSMAHSLEVRAPFLDHEFVEWGMRLPASLKLKGKEGKWILKKALEAVVPQEILYRTKQGFATPLAQVFQDRSDAVRVRLLGVAMADCGLFDLQAIDRLIGEHQSAKYDHSGAIWLLLTFEGFLAMDNAKFGAETALAA
jgi:asparagine synthase (glutamine-hydrolysing)